MKIYLATGNKNKKREMCELLPEHTILIPSDEGIDFAPEETGTTFYENSLIKAQNLYEIVHCPVIADDSGICVDALGGAPGIYSSRYAGPDFMHGKPDGQKISQEEQNIFLIKQVNDAIKSGNIPKGELALQAGEHAVDRFFLQLFAQPDFLLQGQLLHHIEHLVERQFVV